VTRSRGLAATALLSCAVLLLATSQPWVRTVREVAPGAPRARGEVGALELVPWLAPVAVVAGVAVLAGLAGMRWARPVAAVAAVAALVGTSAAVLGAGGAGSGAGGAVVDASATGWLWVGAAAATLLGPATVGWATVRPGRAGGPPSRVAAPGAAAGQDPDGSEARRRQEAQDWRDLSDGHDPTDG
jgi:hypothetical protein